MTGFESNSADLPNAMDDFRSITATVGVRPATFCDYDGTLTDIVNDPADALLPPATRTQLQRLSVCCPLGIVSGRGLSEIRELVGVLGIMYVGSHGFEIAALDGEVFEPDEAKKLLGDLARAEAHLTPVVADLPGIMIERKRFSLAVHTRRAGSDEARQLAAAAAEAYVLETGSRFTIQRGKEVSELRPAMDWDKGSAVSLLVDELHMTGSHVLYIGDDLTDEAAFRWVTIQGGVAIVVGSADRTSATYRLGDPSEVAGFLGRLADRVC